MPNLSHPRLNNMHTHNTLFSYMLGKLTIDLLVFCWSRRDSGFVSTRTLCAGEQKSTLTICLRPKYLYTRILRYARCYLDGGGSKQRRVSDEPDVPKIFQFFTYSPKSNSELHCRRASASCSQLAREKSKQTHSCSFPRVQPTIPLLRALPGSMPVRTTDLAVSADDDANLFSE